MSGPLRVGNLAQFIQFCKYTIYTIADTPTARSKAGRAGVAVGCDWE